MKMFILSRKLVFCSTPVRIFSGSVPFKPWGSAKQQFKQNKSVSMLRRFCFCHFELLSIFYNSAAAVVNEFGDAVMRIDAGAKCSNILNTLLISFK